MLNYNFDKSILINILNENNISYSKLKEKKCLGDNHFELFFLNESQLNAALYVLNLRKYSHLYCKIVNYRINLENLKLYVIPFNL